jgi:sialic acid synthase SpsE
VPNAQDWKVSAGPEDFPGLVAEIRQVETLIGHGRKEPAPCEAPGTAWALKSLVAARDLPAGRVLAAGDLTAKRPGDGMLPNHLDRVLGRALTRPLAADEPLKPEHLA